MKNPIRYGSREELKRVLSNNNEILVGIMENMYVLRAYQYHYCFGKKFDRKSSICRTECECPLLCEFFLTVYKKILRRR